MSRKTFVNRVSLSNVYNNFTSFLNFYLYLLPIVKQKSVRHRINKMNEMITAKYKAFAKLGYANAANSRPVNRPASQLISNKRASMIAVVIAAVSLL